MESFPFSMQRRVSWGECDPARIYYTPRAINYAVEAVEAWYEVVVGLSWTGLVERYDLDAPFVHIECDYLRPLVASQVVRLRVWVCRADCTSVAFVVSGEDEKGASCFRARLVGVFVEAKTLTPLAIPAEIRQRIESYRARCGEADETLNRSNFPGVPAEPLAEGAEAGGMGQYRLPSGATLFARQRRVVYGDCDASGRIYAPKAFDYAVEAIEEWFEDVPGVSWMDLVCLRKQGAPFVTAGCDYLRPMVPGQSLRVEVRVTRLGGASISFAVTGYDDRGVACFDARLAACFIDQDGFRTMRIPEEFRLRIEAFMAAGESLDKR